MYKGLQIIQTLNKNQFIDEGDGMKKYYVWFIIILSLILYIYFLSGVDTTVVEDLDIPSALGCDLEKLNNGQTIYSFPVSVYDFQDENNPTSFVRIGRGETIGETREDRQTKANRSFVLGLEKIFIMSEDMCRYGINGLLNSLLVNSNISDMGIAIVCKGRVEDYLNLSIKSYPSSADYIEGIIRNARSNNFVSKNYTLMDLYVRIDAEGRNLVLPYIDIENNLPRLTGFALFQGDKMQTYLSIKEAKIMNLLREDDVTGVLTIKQSLDKYIDVQARSKRKVKCYIQGNNYKFVISLNINADLIANEIYTDLNTDPKKISEFQNDMEKEIEKQCYSFIEKMQEEYKADYLDLGRVAAAKVGRDPNTDWNKIVSDSKIEVKVKLKLQSQGRGFY